MSKIIFEPFRIKVVKPIKISTVEERAKWIAQAGYNVFNLNADKVMIDLITDSGTAAMSHHQWAALQSGDESYAGSESFYKLEAIAKDIFQKSVIIPVHQGRAGEHLVFSQLVNEGDIVPSNGHFDTTAANIIDNGGEAVNIPIDELLDTDSYHPFKGNMDVKKLEQCLTDNASKIPFVMLTVTNNTGGGQPVSLENIEAVAKMCKQFDKRFIIDGCRFAENAYFIKLREKAYKNCTVKEIAQKVFSYASMITFSGKKDALANIGGLVCLNDEDFGNQLKDRLIITEGFSTYGGLAGRDLAAMAQGLEEVLDEEYLKYRLRTIEWMVEQLVAKKIPVLVPAGGHALYLNAARFLPQISPEHFPGIAVVIELFIRGGIRVAELGNVAFGRRDEKGNHIFPPLDLVRFALPRRAYTEAHMGYVVEKVIELYEDRKKVKGWDFEMEAQGIRHFRSTFKRAD